jgi:hypothetical protein
MQIGVGSILEPQQFITITLPYLSKKRSPAQSRTALLICSEMDYSDVFPAALALAQRAFAAAEILALAAALIFLFFAGALAAGFTPLTLAHRAF